MSRFRTGRAFEPNLSEESEAEDGLRRESDEEDLDDDGMLSVDEDGNVSTCNVAPPVSQPPGLIDIDLSAILCKVHALHLDPDCGKCKSVQAVVNPEVLKRVRAAQASSDSIPDASSRMSNAQPKQRPTLILSANSLEYGKSVYYAVPLAKHQFDELIKAYLHLGADQHDELMKNLILEKIFWKGKQGNERGKKVTDSMRDVKNLMMKNLKNKRKCERPLLVAVDEIDSATRALKLVGITMGLEYPEEPPVKTLMGNEVQDYLAYSSDDQVFELPDFPDLLDGVELSKESREAFEANLDVLKTVLGAYKEKCKTVVMEAYGIAANGFLNLENLLNFFL